MSLHSSRTPKRQRFGSIYHSAGLIVLLLSPAAIPFIVLYLVMKWSAQ